MQVQKALRSRELAFEVRRRWAAAEQTATPEGRAAAEDKVLALVSDWTGRPVRRQDIDSIVNVG